MRWTLAALALLPLAACGAAARAADVAPLGWRRVATAEDRERIRTWRETWMKALAKASPTHAAEIAAAGAILQPDAALLDPTPPSGDYQCRVYKVGAKAEGNRDFTAAAPVACRVTANELDQLRFTVLDGAQRPNGTLYPDSGRRLVFLGSMILSDERKSMRYGTDTERSIAGTVERIAPDRWRLVLPRPRWESMLEVIELAPGG